MSHSPFERDETDSMRRRSIILQTATDIEVPRSCVARFSADSIEQSDCFWAILTASGYKDALLKSTANVEALAQSSEWFQTADIGIEMGKPGFACV